MEHRIYFLGHTVKYTGEKLRRLSKKANAWGKVVGYVKGPNSEIAHEFEVVVEFGDGSYVVKESELAPYNFTEKETFTVDVQRISRKWDEE